MAPPEKRPRSDQDCEWDDFDDVPFEVVEQAEVYASQIFGKKRVDEPVACTGASLINRCGDRAAVPRTSTTGAATATQIGGPLSVMAPDASSRSAKSSSVAYHDYASALPLPNSESQRKPPNFRRINSSPEIPATESTQIIRSQLNKEQLDQSTQKEVERLGQCLLKRDGEIKMLRTTLKQKTSDLMKLKQDKLLELQSQSSAESERELKLQRQLESLRTQLQFQERELAELRFQLSSARRQQQSTAAGRGNAEPAAAASSPAAAALSPCRTAAPLSAGSAAGFPSSKSFYGAVRRMPFDDAHTSPEKASPHRLCAEPMELPVHSRHDDSCAELVKNLVSCGFCELLLTDTVSPFASEVIDKSADCKQLSDVTDRAKHSMQRLLTASSSSESRYGGYSARDTLSLLPTADVHVRSYASLLRQQQPPSTALPPSQRRAAGSAATRATTTLTTAPCRTDGLRCDAGNGSTQAAMAATAAERAERCLLGLSHVAAFSMDACEALLGSSAGAGATLAVPQSGCDGHAARASGPDQLLSCIITCADTRLCQDDPHRLMVCACAMQLLLSLCCCGSGPAASHVAKEACSRFKSLVHDGLLAAALRCDDPAVVQVSLALLEPIVSQDGGCQPSVICCPSVGWCIFEFLSTLLKKSYSYKTTDVHLQVLHLIGCLCMLRSCREHLTAEPVVCSSHKQVVASVVSLIYSHVLAYEEACISEGWRRCINSDRTSEQDPNSQLLDKTILQQGLHVLHTLAQIDSRFSSRHAAVEHEYAYVMNFASQFYREQSKGHGPSQLSSSYYADEESLLDSLWDFEDEENSDDKEAVMTDDHS